MLRPVGFTLIELLITLTVLSLVLLLGAPSLTHVIHRSRSLQQASYLTSSLHMARLAAIDSGNKVSLCPATADLSSCSRDWNDTLMLYRDSNGNGEFDSADEILHSSASSSSHFSRHYNNGNKVTYQPEGHVSNPGTFTLCPSNNDPHYAKAVVINMEGRIKPSKDSDHNGIDEDPKTNLDLSCDPPL